MDEIEINHPLFLFIIILFLEIDIISGVIICLFGVR